MRRDSTVLRNGQLPTLAEKIEMFAYHMASNHEEFGMPEVVSNIPDSCFMQLIERIVTGWENHWLNGVKCKEAPSLPLAELLSLLSPREVEIASLIAQEKTNDQIAAELNLTNSTIRTHMKSITNKWNVASRIGIANIMGGYVPEVPVQQPVPIRRSTA